MKKPLITIGICFAAAIFAQLIGVSFAAPYPTGVGGTGTSATPASGTILIGNGAGSYTAGNLNCSGACSISNGSGTITVIVTGGTSSGTVFLLTGGHGISLSPASITASGTVAINTSTVIADVLSSGQFLPSSTVLVATVNGQSGAVTIGIPATTTINNSQATVFRLVGDGTTVTSTVNGATTTFSIINTGNWAGTWQNATSGTYYPASNPSGYISSTTGSSLYYPLNSNPAGYATSTNSSTFARAVTETVCAANAPDTKNCDFFATATSSNLAIQAAVNAAPGGQIALSLGKFVLASKVVINTSGTVLIGQGNGPTTVIAANGFAGAMFLVSSTPLQNVAFTQFKIDGNAANATTSVLIQSTDMRNSIITNMWLTNSGADCVDLYGDANLGWYNTVSYNDIDHCGSYGTHARFDEYNYIVNNTYSFETTGCNESESDDDDFSYNTCDDVGGIAAYFPFGVGGYNISDNKFSRGSTSYIVLRQISNSVIAGNLFDNVASNSYAIENGEFGGEAGSNDVFSGNISRGAANSGSIGIGESSTSTNNIYIGNTFSTLTVSIPYLLNGSSTAYTLLTPSGITTGNSTTTSLTITSLLSQNCLGTNANGVVGVGTCSGGSASGTVNPATISDVGIYSGATALSGYSGFTFNATNGQVAISTASNTTALALSSGNAGTSITAGGVLNVHANNGGYAANLYTNTSTPNQLLEITSDSPFVTTASGTQMLSNTSTQLVVSSTAGFPSSGDLIIQSSTSQTENANSVWLQYTSITSTTFVGTAGTFYHTNTSFTFGNGSLVHSINTNANNGVVEETDWSLPGGAYTYKMNAPCVNNEFTTLGYQTNIGQGQYEQDTPCSIGTADETSTDLWGFNGRNDTNTQFNRIMIIDRPGVEEGKVALGYQNFGGSLPFGHLTINNSGYGSDPNISALPNIILYATSTQTADFITFASATGTAYAHVDNAGDFLTSGSVTASGTVAAKTVIVSATSTLLGNVGIGTTTPMTTLDIEGASSTLFIQCFKTLDHSTTSRVYNWLYSSGTTLMDTATQPSFCQ